MSGGSDLINRNFYDVLIMWFIALLSAWIGKMIKCPPLLMYIIIGAVAGNLNWVARHEAIEWFAEFSIVIVFFSLGFEETVEHFVESMGFSWGVALIGAIVPFGCGWICGIIFWPDAGWHVHLTIATSVTATAVSLTLVILQSLNLLRTRSALGIMSSAVLDDVGCLILVSILLPIVTSAVTPDASANTRHVPGINASGTFTLSGTGFSSIASNTTALADLKRGVSNDIAGNLTNMSSAGVTLLNFTIDGDLLNVSFVAQEQKSCAEEYFSTANFKSSLNTSSASVSWLESTFAVFRPWSPLNARFTYSFVSAETKDSTISFTKDPEAHAGLNASDVGWVIGKVIIFFIIIWFLHVAVLPDNVTEGWVSYIPILRRYGIRDLIIIGRGDQVSLIVVTFGMAVGMIGAALNFHAAVGAYFGGLLLDEKYFQLPPLEGEEDDDDDLVGDDDMDDGKKLIVHHGEPVEAQFIKGGVGINPTTEQAGTQQARTPGGVLHHHHHHKTPSSHNKTSIHKTRATPSRQAAAGGNSPSQREHTAEKLKKKEKEGEKDHDDDDDGDESSVPPPMKRTHTCRKQEEGGEKGEKEKEKSEEKEEEEEEPAWVKEMNAAAAREGFVESPRQKKKGEGETAEHLDQLAKELEAEGRRKQKHVGTGRVGDDDDDDANESDDDNEGEDGVDEALWKKVEHCATSAGGDEEIEELRQEVDQVLQAVADEEERKKLNKMHEAREAVAVAAFMWLGPIFFVNLGASFKVEAELLATAIPQALGITAILAVGQIVSATLAAKYVPGGYTWVESILIGLGMCGRAELYFVVLNEAQRSDVLKNDIFFPMALAALFMNILLAVSMTLFQPTYLKYHPLEGDDRDPEEVAKLLAEQKENEKKEGSTGEDEMKEKKGKEGEDGDDGDKESSVLTVHGSDGSRSHIPERFKLLVDRRLDELNPAAAIAAVGPSSKIGEKETAEGEKKEERRWPSAIVRRGVGMQGVADLRDGTLVGVIPTALKNRRSARRQSASRGRAAAAAGGGGGGGGTGGRTPVGCVAVGTPVVVSSSQNEPTAPPGVTGGDQQQQQQQQQQQRQNMTEKERQKLSASALRRAEQEEEDKKSNDNNNNNNNAVPIISSYRRRPPSVLNFSGGAKREGSAIGAYVTRRKQQQEQDQQNRLLRQQQAEAQAEEKRKQQSAAGAAGGGGEGNEGQQPTAVVTPDRKGSSQPNNNKTSRGKARSDINARFRQHKQQARGAGGAGGAGGEGNK